MTDAHVIWMKSRGSLSDLSHISCFWKGADRFHRWFCKNKKQNNTHCIRRSDSVCDCRSRSEKQFTVAIVLLPVWMGETKSVWLLDCHAKAWLIITAPLGPETQKQEVSRRQRKLLVFWWPVPWFSDFSHRRGGSQMFSVGKDETRRDGPVDPWRFFFLHVNKQNSSCCLLPSPAKHMVYCTGTASF